MTPGKSKKFEGLGAELDFLNSRGGVREVDEDLDARLFWMCVAHCPTNNGS